MRSELLEPCAEMIRTHGSEGRTVQRCAVLTRRYAFRSPLLAEIGDERTLPLTLPNG